ncbi:hypothetical protein EZV62_025573 [Acer yangbiense]|uniref:DUF674 domain-containing protein n=1 Tax=Acer yangbiense TaxID=1000413 RepID=A0A5C7GY81_9ROSI|nr:hypothetical protein EZV62_025573 [Acer yangbiense]
MDMAKLKLIVNTKARKVLFAEAGKDFIDFLIYLLSLPIATAVGILTGGNLNPVVGSFSHIYESLKKLPESFLQPNQAKNSLLNPRAPVYATGIPLMLSYDNFRSQKSYICSGCYNYMADVPNLNCFSCKGKVNRVMSYVPPSPANYSLGPVEDGFLKGLATYIVMDNLEFMPMSTEIFLSLLKKSDVKDLDSLEVDLGVEEGLRLLKLSLESKTILTSLYFGDAKLVTYMVMDNSEFRPMSTKDFVTLFNNLRLEKEVTELEEMVVDFGTDEVRKLLKTSMENKTVLTSVFLGKIGEQKRS